jgi:hypothetical protein
LIFLPSLYLTSSTATVHTMASRSSHPCLRRLGILAVVATSLTLLSCQSKEEPRPFSSRHTNDLEQPPRYGQGNRYLDNGIDDDDTSDGTPPPPRDDRPPMSVMEPEAPQTPGTSAPDANPPASPPPPAIDSGLALKPSTPATTAPSDGVPFAKPVPGKPGLVYSPKNPDKKINVGDIKPGTKVTAEGEVFRVPYP